MNLVQIDDYVINMEQVRYMQKFPDGGLYISFGDEGEQNGTYFTLTPEQSTRFLIYLENRTNVYCIP